jgi:DNA replication protein DnaC
MDVPFETERIFLLEPARPRVTGRRGMVGFNVLAFGLPGRGKTHFLATLGQELILRHGKRVLFRPTFKLVGKLLTAKRDLRLEAELKKLDRYEVLILDDIGCVQQSREEMEVLFTLLAERYERRSLLISFQPVGSNLQGPAHHDGGDRPVGASFDHPGV